MRRHFDVLCIAFVAFICRVRPLSDLERERNDKNIVTFPGEGGVWVSDRATSDATGDATGDASL